MTPKKQFRPSNLRTLLVVLLVVVTLGGAGIFYFGLTMVREYAMNVDKSAVDATASAKQIDDLSKLKGQLAQSTTLITKANQLFATQSSYQAQVLNDVKNYADASGLSIAHTSFNSPANGSTYGITVSFKAPVSYSKLIAFLNNVEGNLPKLQVSSIALGHIAGGKADTVRVGDIKIDIAVR